MKRGSRALREPKLRSSEFNRLRFFSDQTHRLEYRVHMVPNVEELRAKLQVHLLANRERFEDGEIPVLESGAPNDIAPCIAKGEWDGVVDKGAGVEQRPRDTGFPVGIADEVRPDFIKSDAPSAVTA